jgi:hypothetical protein
LISPYSRACLRRFWNPGSSDTRFDSGPCFRQFWNPGSSATRSNFGVCLHQFWRSSRLLDTGPVVFWISQFRVCLHQFWSSLHQWYIAIDFGGNLKQSSIWSVIWKKMFIWSYNRYTFESFVKDLLGIDFYLDAMNVVDHWEHSKYEFYFWHKKVSCFNCFNILEFCCVHVHSELIELL